MNKLRLLASLASALLLAACGGGGGGGGGSPPPPPPADTTPPDTNITSAPTDPTNLADASFTFTSTEGGSTFECSLDGAAFAACTSPQDYMGLADGPHTFDVRATDAAGNTDPSPATSNWTVDTVEPDTTIDSAPGSPTNNPDADFEFSSSEAGSTFECSLDSAAFAPCTSPASFPGLADGPHDFAVRATDPAGNTDSTPATSNWTVDTVPPETTITGAPASTSDSSDASFEFTASEPSTFECSIDSGPFSACTSPTDYSGLAEGPHNFEVRATDAAGNTDPTPATWNWAIDLGPPNPTNIVVNSDAIYATSVSELTARLTASDNVGVTGYLITEHNATDPMNVIPPYLDPLLSDPEWVAVASTTSLDIDVQFALTQQYAIGDTVELCAWYRDAAGNISARVCDDIRYGVDWEVGIGFWSADNGVWQVGTPTAGPAGCFAGTQCAGTVLDGNYPSGTDSRLVSASMVLPAVGGSDELHLRFQQWFSFASGDTGQVQVSVWDATGMTWGSWINEGELVASGSGGWSLKDVDLTAYAGETVRIAFFHIADGIGVVSTGWYVDDITIVQTTPAFTGDFENGWDHWGADRGVWQVGTPTAGPAGCFAGTQCAGTVLDGNYPSGTDSRLVSASTVLPAVGGSDELHLRFQQWFSFASGDTGQVQVSVWDATGMTWGSWIDVGTAVSGVSGGWSLKDVDLTAYAGEIVRIAFFHTADGIGVVSTGWYVDDIEVVVF